MAPNIRCYPPNGINNCVFLPFEGKRHYLTAPLTNPGVTVGVCLRRGALALIKESLNTSYKAKEVGPDEAF